MTSDQAEVQRIDITAEGAGGMYSSPLILATPPSPIFAMRIAAWRPGVLPRHPDDTDHDQDGALA
jgi:hypothetical protein